MKNVLEFNLKQSINKFRKQSKKFRNTEWTTGTNTTTMPPQHQNKPYSAFVRYFDYGTCFYSVDTE